MVIATIVIAIATAVNLFVAIAMWHEMHATGTDTHELAVSAGKQIDLMRQQLVGTQAAVVVVHEYPGIESTQTNFYGFYIAFRNDGHTIASKAHATLTAQTKTAHGLKPITSLNPPCDFDLPPILPTKIQDHRCSFEGLNERSWKPIADLRQTLAIEGALKYWNGFEEVPPQKICLLFVPTGPRNKFGGGDGPNRFVECDAYRSWIDFMDKRLAGNENAQRPQQ